MGRAILHAIYEAHPGRFTLVAAMEAPSHPAVGRDVGQLIGMETWDQKTRDAYVKSPVSVSKDINAKVPLCDVVIDFSAPACTLSITRAAKTLAKPMVIGTTGLTEADRNKLRKAAQTIPILFSPNMSVGVNVLFKLLAVATAALGDAYDVEIIDLHHRQKKDAPSGTAIGMGNVIAAVRGTMLSHKGRFVRQRLMGERPSGEIGIQSLRGGDVVGDHTCIFAGPGERIELIHRAHSRQNFARGALIAANWIATQPPGLYSMMDVLGLGPL